VPLHLAPPTPFAVLHTHTRAFPRQGNSLSRHWSVLLINFIFKIKTDKPTQTADRLDLNTEKNKPKVHLSPGFNDLKIINKKIGVKNGMSDPLASYRWRL
jgi:hypothetical protein